MPGRAGRGLWLGPVLVPQVPSVRSETRPGQRLALRCQYPGFAVSAKPRIQSLQTHSSQEFPSLPPRGGCWDPKEASIRPLESGLLPSVSWYLSR